MSSFVYLQNSQTVHALEVRLKNNSQVVALKVPEKEIQVKIGPYMGWPRIIYFHCLKLKSTTYVLYWIQKSA